MKSVVRVSLSLVVIGVLAGCSKGDNNGSPAAAPFNAQANVAGCNPNDPTVLSNPQNPCNPNNPNSPLNRNNPNSPYNANNPNSPFGGGGANTNDVARAANGQIVIVNRTFHLLRGYGIETVTDNCDVKAADGDIGHKAALYAGKDDFSFAFDAQGMLVVTIGTAVGQMRSLSPVAYQIDPQSSAIVTAPFIVGGRPSAAFVRQELFFARKMQGALDNEMKDEYGIEAHRNRLGTNGSHSYFGLNSGIGIDPSFGQGSPAVINMGNNELSLNFTGGIRAALSADPLNRLHVTVLDIDSADFEGSATVKAPTLECLQRGQGQFLNVQMR